MGGSYLAKVYAIIRGGGGFTPDLIKIGLIF